MMTSTNPPAPKRPTPRLWLTVVAGTWFALLSQGALWLVDAALLPGAPNKFTTGAAIAASMAATAFLAGAACWWVGFHRGSRFLGTGASVGLAAAILSLVVNPFAWVFSFASFLLLPFVHFALFVLGGVGLELGFWFCTRVWPNHTVKRDAPTSGAPLTSSR
jgi:hypothetical protein